MLKLSRLKDKRSKIPHEDRVNHLVNFTGVREHKLEKNGRNISRSASANIRVKRILEVHHFQQPTSQRLSPVSEKMVTMVTGDVDGVGTDLLTLLTISCFFLLFDCL